MNVLITLVFWKSVLMTHVLITRFLYDVLISRVLISRVDCIIVVRVQALLAQFPIALTTTRHVLGSIPGGGYICFGGSTNLQGC